MLSSKFHLVIHGVEEFLDKNKLFNHLDIYLSVILFISIVLSMAGSWFFVKEIRRNNAIKNVAKEFYGRAEESYGARIKEEEAKRKTYGNIKQKNFLYKVDTAIEHSGIKRLIPILNTELFILLVIGSAFVTSLVLINLYKNLFIALLGAITTIFIFYMVITLLGIKNDKQIEEYILQFTDLLESYSNASDDIIYLFDQVASAFYNDNVLKSALIQCVIESRTNGDLDAAFDRLIIRINHRKFREIIQSLEQCSKNNANYSSVIRSSHESLRLYLAEKEVRRTKVNQARVTIVTLVGIFIFCIKIIEQIIMTDFITFFMASSAGIGLLFACFSVFLFTVWKMVTMGKS